MRKASWCFLVLLILASILYVGCSGPGGGGLPDGHDILPPEQVEVKVAGNDPILTWAGVSGAEGYVIFRKQGSGDYYVDTGHTVSGTTFTDTGVLANPGAASFRYAVASYAGEKRSVLSTPTGVVYVNVPNVWASRFEYADKVVLEWNRHDTAVSYKIYRTDNPTSGAPEFVAQVPGSATQTEYSLENTESLPDGHTAEAGTPYYYRVTWIDSSSIEHGANDAPYFMGIHGDAVDYDEPHNNDYMKLSASDAVSPYVVPATLLTGYLYNIYDGSKDRVDGDWFRIADPNDLLKITVQVDLAGKPSDFLENELRFAVRYGSSGSTEELFTTGVNNAGKITYTLIYEHAGIDSANVDVYFLLSTETKRALDLFGKYAITFTCN